MRRLALIAALILLAAPQARAAVNGVSVDHSKGVLLLGSPAGAANCNAATTGAIRYNSTTPRIEFCNGSVWASVGGGSTTLDAITAAVGNQAGIANGAYTIQWNWDTLAGGSALKLASISTAAASNAQTLLNIALSGANGTTTQTTYGEHISNTHTGTSSTNIGLYATASGGTNNYAAIFNAGNVGIGTTSPGQNLEVNNTLRLYNGAGNHLGVLDFGQGDVLIKNNPLGGATGDFQITNWNGSGYNTGIFLQSTTGNVGIGTTTPGAVLDINGTTSPEISLEHTGALKLEIGIPTATNNYINGSAINDITFRQTGGQKILFSTSATGATNDLTLSGGLVGIGTTTPNSNLQIGAQTQSPTATPVTLSLGGTYSNTAGANPKLKLYDDGTGADTYGLGISSGSLDFMVGSGGNFNWYVDGGDTMALSSDTLYAPIVIANQYDVFCCISSVSPSTNAAYYGYGQTEAAYSGGYYQESAASTLSLFGITNANGVSVDPVIGGGSWGEYYYPSIDVIANSGTASMVQSIYDSAANAFVWGAKSYSAPTFSLLR